MRAHPILRALAALATTTAACAVDVAGPPPTGAVVDPATVPDLARSEDLATVPDLAMNHDLAMILDLATISDLATIPDRAAIADLAEIPDLAKFPDAAMIPDLTARDLAHPDLACVPMGGGTPFADRVLRFAPGANGGFNQNQLPRIVLGPPLGAGAGAGSFDVVSLGNQGKIVLAFDDLGAINGPGPDLIVFENAFGANFETGFVAASEDGQKWREWPCDPTDALRKYPYCAGVKPVFSNPMNNLSPTDPAVAGGDAFDLADIGLGRARYLRIRDSGKNKYGADTGGFDLDAVSIVNAAPINCW